MNPSYEQAPPRRRSGCLWGCLGVLLILVIILGGVFGYTAWFLHKNFDGDSRIQTIMAIVQSDARAAAVLGHNIHIAGVESRTFAMGTGIGKSASYTLRLIGSNGEGVLKVNLDLSGGKTKVTLMILTGSDGHPHTLVGKEPESPLQQSI
jgi:flagellar basal body-associated protein FliL